MTDEPLRLTEGIYGDIPEAAYHADCAIEISASASGLRTLLTESPRHAAYDHPKLNPAWEPSESTLDMNKGTILHSLLLGTPQPYVELDFKNYQTNDARTAKADVLKDGLIPILKTQMTDLRTAADAIRKILREEFPKVWEALSDPDTMNEATLIFRRNGVMCRSRCDAFPLDKYGQVYDFKFTGRTAEPEAWSKQLRDRYLFQPVLYTAGIEALRGDDPEFRFLVAEWDAPYGISIHALDPGLQELARRRLDEALEVWSICLKNNSWPGYPPFTHFSEAPGWMLAQEESRVIAREALREAERRRVARETKDTPP